MPSAPTAPPPSSCSSSVSSEPFTSPSKVISSVSRSTTMRAAWYSSSSGSASGSMASSGRTMTYCVFPRDDSTSGLAEALTATASAGRSRTAVLINRLSPCDAATSVPRSSGRRGSRSRPGGGRRRGPRPLRPARRGADRRPRGGNRRHDLRAGAPPAGRGRGRLGARAGDLRGGHGAVGPGDGRGHEAGRPVPDRQRYQVICRHRRAAIGGRGQAGPG